jgi:phosphomannomutase
MSQAAPALLQKMGYEVFELYCTPDGSFPRPPEPTPNHLSELSNFVKTHSLDIGLAFDPDGDRVALVDETGHPLDEELTLSLSVWFVLERKKGPIVANLSTTRRLDDLAQHFGVPIYRTPVGEAQVVKRLCEFSGVIGGEGNGGVILPELNLARDGLVAAAILTHLIKAQGEPLSSLARRLPQYSIVKKKVQIKSDWEVVRERILRALPKGSIDYSDGIRVDTPEYWMAVRPSRTEPVLRIIAEARKDDQAHKLVDLISNLVSE